MPTYIWINTETGEEIEHFTNIDDSDNPPMSIRTSSDSHLWTKRIFAPSIAKRHIPDGLGISKGLAWDVGKEIASLEDEALKRRPEDRAEIKKEIKKTQEMLK